METCLVEMLIMQVNAEYFPLPPSSASEMAYIVSVGALNYSLTLPPSVDPDVVPPPEIIRPAVGGSNSRGVTSMVFWMFFHLLVLGLLFCVNNYRHE